MSLLPFLLALHLLSADSALATSAPSSEIEIRHADNAEYNSEKGEIILSGAVHVVRATMEIRADKIQLLLLDEGGGLKEGVASGRVEILDGNRKAIAKRAVYMSKTSEIVLTGDPVLWDGGNRISAERIVYNINARSMKAEGQVSGVFKEKIGGGSRAPR